MNGELTLVLVVACVASVVSLAVVLVLCACCYRRGGAGDDTDGLDDADYYTRLPQNDVSTSCIASPLCALNTCGKWKEELQIRHLRSPGNMRNCHPVSGPTSVLFTL